MDAAYFPEWLAMVKEFYPITFKPEHRKHPLFHQWYQIVKGITDPDYVQRRIVTKSGVREYKPWDKYGAKCIGIRPDWMNFDKFTNDPVLKPMIENVVSIRNRNRNLDRRKFPNLEISCIDRKDRLGDFNRDNITLTSKSELDYDNLNKYVVNVPVWGNLIVPMSLRELAAFLVTHAGQKLPDGVGPFTMKHRGWDDTAGRDGKFVTKTVVYDEVTPVPLHELRRRARVGTRAENMYAPCRDKSKKEPEFQL